MFSNASEASHWIKRNCEHCWKYKPESAIGEGRCKTEEGIALGFIGEKLSKRVDRITEMRDCPYRQEKRPVYKKQSSAMSLFEGVV